MIVVNYFFYFIQATAPVASLFVTLQNNVTKVNNGKSVFIEYKLKLCAKTTKY